MSKKIESFSVVWINNLKEIINDVEYGYDLDHAMERIEQSAGFVKILFACKFPLTKKDMNKRKKLTGVKPT
jgi:hypothetical protein|tara:strand:+ start:346 stop:558 length:213 start_codon:yes stop_codon:yes gene_type:complete